METTTHLEALAALQKNRIKLQHQLDVVKMQIDAAATAARAAGLTWRQIGSSIGLTPTLAERQYRVIDGMTLAETRAHRLKACREAAVKRAAYRASGKQKDFGLSFAELSRQLGITVSSLQTGRHAHLYRSQMMAMPSGVLTKRYFLLTE